MNVISHALEQFFAGCARAGVRTSETPNTPAKSATTGTVCSGCPDLRCGAEGGVAAGGWRICAREYPVGRLGVPDQRVPYEIQTVAEPEVHKGIGRAKVVPVGPFQRMNQQPLHVILRDDLIELFLNKNNVLLHLLRCPSGKARPGRGASCDAAVNGRAHVEVVFVGLLERGGVGRKPAEANSQHQGREECDARVTARKMSSHAREILED